MKAAYDKSMGRTPKTVPVSNLQRQPNSDDNLAHNFQLLEQIPALIAVMHGDNHRYDFVNKVYQQTFGVDDGIIGRPIAEILPGLAEQGLLDLLDKVYRTGKSYHGKEQRIFIPANGHPERELYLNMSFQPIPGVNGSIEGVFIHAVDVTPLVKARQKSDELAAELEAIFSSIPDGIFMAKEGVITRVNQTGAESLGYDSPEEVPRRLEDLYTELQIKHNGSSKEARLEDSVLAQALGGKTARHESALIMNPVTKRRMILRTSASPVRDRRGRIIGAISVNSDVTEYYELQQKINKNKVRQRVLRQKAKLLKEQNDELIKLNTLKDEFIALASHQLRTPATSVKQYLGMILEGYVGEVPPQQLEFLERAYKGNERQLRIVDDILRVAQVDLQKTQLRMTDVDICELMHYITEDQAGRFLERDQRLKVDLPEECLYVLADHDRLRMALDNIVDNASKYTGHGKSIAVAVRKDDKKGQAIITVTDEGVGIAKTDIPKLFQKFSRIHNEYSVEAGGSGLGLYWTNKIIDLHGGSITVNSQLGIGTTFTIALPVAPTPAA